jgi:hypothetical protein
MKEVESNYYLGTGKRFSNFLSNFPILLITGLLITTLYSLREIRVIKMGNHDIISFTYKNKRIVSDKKLLILGETKNFIFVHNLKVKETKVYKKEEITDYEVDLVTDEDSFYNKIQ